ncbi:hypothetical protein [Fusobacterium perfoetens]|uniref:hypothetical protein n=1 Tax=Fusobacterium perfoetens TaxID=852 RepID=UPI0026F1572D|nr:hypothetical protein [Fusobacterium perfoetens]
MNRMTQAELSRKLKIKPQSLIVTLKNLKDGKGCRTTTIIKIAAAGDVECVELLKVE